MYIITLYFKVLSHMPANTDDSLKTLQDIRSIMERSTRFLSLSGWSGVWAGCVGLVGFFIARSWVADVKADFEAYRSGSRYLLVDARFVWLALAVMVVAVIGGYYFTWRKTRRQGGTVWNSASRRMMMEIAIPLAAGGLFALHLYTEGRVIYIAPVCLLFYGMALINGSKHTLSDIKYLGLCEMALGCINLFFLGYGLTFWALGFGLLHIVYGIIMWNRYDKHIDTNPA